MANSLITIQLKLDALKIQVETPTVKSSGEPASTPTGASSRAGQPSGGAPDLRLDEVRAQFNSLAADLKAASDSIRGIQDIAAVFTSFAESLKEATSNIKAQKSESSGTSSTQDDTAAKSREEQAKRQAAADAEAAAASAKKTEASKEEAAASNVAAQSAEENAQATREQAEAQVKSTEGMDAIIKAAARLQIQFLESTDITKSSAAAQEKLNQIAKARTTEELKLGASASGRKSQIATLFESILPVSLDAEFKTKAERFNSTAKGLFVNFAPGVDRASEAVKTLTAELDDIRRASSARIQRDPTGVDPLREAASVRGQQEQALSRFREAGGGGNVQFQDTKAALFAASFQAQTSNIIDSMRLLSEKIESGASELEIEPLEAAVRQAITGITDFSSRIVSSAASPFVTTRPDLGGGVTGPRQDLTPLITQNIIPKQAKQELTDFQQQLLTLAQTLIRTEEVTSVLPRIFRELTKDVANFETNQRVLRQALQFGGNLPIGGPERAEVAKGVGSGLRTRIGAGGEFLTPAGTDTATSFELLNANIQKLKLNVQGLQRGTQLDKLFTFTDAAGNVRKIQTSVKQLGDSIGTVQVRAKEVSKDLFNRVSVRAALSRVATWGAAAGIVFGAINAFKGAVRTIVDTESAVVNLAKVMGESREGFDEFTAKATEAGLAIAQKFGQPLEGVLETMINFGQQGLTFPEVEAGASASALASVVTTLNQPQAADALTAATQQFGLSLLDATSIVDKFNNVANNAAVTETVLTDALKKTGIAARNAGVDLDQFNGIVAAIAEQTRQSGNEIGTALRFIFSRINTQEAENGLAKIGIAVKDAGGNLRPFVDIITELRNSFSSLSKVQQTQAAISIAGTRRFNTLLALIQNFDSFQKSLVNSTNSAGTAIEEAGIQAQTSAFKITQLKNSAAGAAVSFGAVLTPALKIATDVASGFFNIISNLPTAVQALAVSLGAAGIAFAKFSQTFVSLGEAALLPGGGVFGTLAGALTKGATRNDIQRSTPGVAANIANVAGGGGEALFAARAIGDFGKAQKGAESFTEAIKNSGRVLVDLNGQQVTNTQNLTKFTAVTRGYRTVAKDAFGTATQAAATSNLGLLAMNTTIGRMSVALVGLSTRFLKTIPLVGTLANKAGDALQNTSTAAGRLAGSLLKIGASVGILIVAFRAFEAARDFLTKDGDAVAKSLEPEIAKRQKLIRELANQQSAVSRLAQSQRELLRLQVEETQQPEEIRREAIRRGEFKSPRLEQQRLDAAQREVNNQVGFATPQLIESVDDFGNVTLKAADAFESLASAAGTTNERLLALSQSKIAKAFLDDADATDGFFRSLTHGVAESFDFLPFLDDVADATISVGKRFNEAQSALEDFRSTRSGPQVSNAIEEANRLGIPLREVNEDIAKELDRLTKNVQEAAGPITENYSKIIKALESAPPNQAVTLLNDLGNAVEALAKKQSAFSGVATSTADFAERFALTNSEALKGIKANIKFNAEDTKEALNEAGFLEAASRIGTRTKEEFSKTFAEGDLVIIDGRQLQVEINAFGDRVVKVWNESADRFDQIRLADVLTTDGLQEVFSFAAEGLKQQINRTVLEITRVTTGAARGTLLPREFDLGADRSFDLTAQQRVAQTDESLISDLLDAERALTTRRDVFKAQLEAGDAVVTTAIVAEIQNLQAAVDETSTIVKFRTQIEEVGKSFEKAIDDIERSNIAERITTEFSGVLGAERGAAPRTFNRPLTRAELGVEQRTAVDSPELVRFVNAVTEAEKAQGELIKNATLAIRDIDRIGQDFRTATASGGIADRASLSQIASAQLSRAGDPLDAQLHQITVEQLNEDKKQTKFLERIAAAQELGPANLVTALTDGLRSGALTGDQTRRVEGLTSEQLKTISTSALIEFSKTQGTETPTNIQEEIISRRVLANRGRLNLDSINARLGASSAAPGTTDAQKEAQEAKKATAVVELDPTSKALIEAAISAGVGQSTERAGTIVNRIRNALIESGGEVAKGINRQLSEQGGLEQVNAGIIDFLNSTTDIFKDLAPAEQRPARSFDEEQSLARRRAEDIEAGARRTVDSAFFREARALAEVFALLADTTSEAEKSIEDNLISTLRGLGTTQALAGLGVAGAQAGATAGVETLALDVGKALSSLTGRDLTERDSPDLIRAANVQKTSLDALVRTFTEVQSDISRLITARDEAAAGGDTSRAAILTTNINKLAEQAALFNPEIEKGAESLKKFAEAVNVSDSVNQLTVDIAGLFKALEKEVDLTFDRTSIESGLGNTVFSLLRPTFEQFEQGQAGFATAFERSIASIDFQEASREITPQEADRQRGRAGFERDEGVIRLAQERENKSLQIQITAAEQIRKRLLDFAASGGAGAEQARGLFDQLTQDLESAGDVIQSSVGSRSIRNPLTGREEDVPASQILEFKGLPSLEGLQAEVGKLAQQSQQEQAIKNASLINEPIVNSVLTVGANIVDELVALKKQSEIGREEATSEISAVNQASLIAQEIGKLRTVAPGPAQTQRARVVTDEIQGLVRERGLETATKALEVTFVDANTTIPQALEQFVASTESTKEAIDLINEPLGLLSTNTDELAEKFNLVKTGLEEFLQIVERTASSIPGLQGSGNIQRRASGGLIFGPGGPKDDRVPILASPGEFVVNAAAVSKFGAKNLERINAQGSTGKQEGNRFQNGGFVFTEEEDDKELERTKQNLLKASAPTGDPQKDSLRRGQFVRFDGPTGTDKFESDIFSDNLADVENRLSNLPPRSQIAENVKEADSREKRRILNLESKSRRRLITQANELSGTHYTKVLEDGTVSFSATRSPGSVKVGGRLGRNIDISSAKNFRADVENRKDRISRINKIPKVAEAQERKLRTERLKLLGEEENRLAEVEKETSFLDNSQRLSRTVASANADMITEVNNAVKSLIDLRERAETPQGRALIKTEEETVRSIIGQATRDINFWTQRAQNLRPQNFQFKHPLTGEFVGEETTLFLHGDTTLGDNGISPGGIAYTQNKTLEHLLQGRYAQQAADTNQTFDNRFFRTAGNVTGNLDFLLASDANPVVKTAFSAFAIPGQVVSDAAEGVANLTVSTGGGISKLITGKTSLSDAPEGVLDLAKSTGTGAVASVVKAGTGIGETSAAISLGEPLEQVLSKLAETGAATANVALLAAPLVKPLAFTIANPAAAAANTARFSRNVGIGLKNKTFSAVEKAKGAAGAAKNRVITAKGNITDKFAARSAAKAAAAEEASATAAAGQASTAAKIAENAAIERAAVQAAKEVVEETASQSAILSRPDFLEKPKGRVGRFADKLKNILPEPDPVFGRFQRRGQVQEAVNQRRALRGEPTAAEGTFSPPTRATIESILGEAVEGSDLLPGLGRGIQRRPVGTEVTGFTAAPESSVVLPSRTGALNIGVRGGTSLESSGIRGILSRKFDEFQLQRALDEGLEAGAVPDLSQIQPIVRGPGITTGLENIQPVSGRLGQQRVNLDEFIEELRKPTPVIPNAPKLPIRLDPSGKGSTFGRPAPVVAPTATPEFLRSVTGFRDSRQAAEAVSRLKIPQSRLDALLDASPTEIARFRKSFRDLEAGKAGPVPARPRDPRRAALIGEKESVVSLRTDRAALRDAPDELVTTRARLLEDIEGRKRQEARIESLRQRGELPDRSQFPAAGASDIGIDFPEAGGLARTSALAGQNVVRRRLIDNLLGEGAFTSLKKSGVEIRDSVFENLSKGQDIKGITRDLKDELLKASVSREEFINIRQLRTGQRGFVNPNVRGPAKPNPEVDRAVREYLQADREYKAIQAKQESEFVKLRELRDSPDNVEGVSSFEDLLELLNKQSSSSPSASAVFKAEAKAADAVLREAAKGAGLKTPSAIRRQVGLEDTQLASLPGVEDKTKLALRRTQRFASGTREFASGGQVTGPGGPKSDSIPILASNGEFIVNAETVNRLGLPFFNSLNKGQSLGGKFAEGGIVGNSRGGNTDITVNVNTDEMAASITEAITSALESAEFPELEVNTEGVSVPVDFPDNGIPLDSSSLDFNLGDSLGSAVRNRLESVEGTVDGLREDSNRVLDLVESVDFSAIGTLTDDVSNIKTTLEPLSERVLAVEGKFETQKQEILNEMFTFVNEQIDNISIDTDLNSRIDNLSAQNNTRFEGLSDSIFQAISTANRAMTEALKRI